MTTSSTDLPTVCYDLDLSKVEDEPLVIMAQEVGYEPARNELIDRFWPVGKQLVRRFAFHLGLQQTDLDDAEQDAAFWIIDAIGHYRSDEYLRSGGCHFRSFLYRVLRCRFIDMLRTGRSYHVPCSSRLEHRPQFFETRDTESLGQLAISGAVTATGNARQDSERFDRLRQLEVALSRLDAPMQELWTLLCQGWSLRDIAVQLECSYDQVKRSRRTMLDKLVASLTADE